MFEKEITFDQNRIDGSKVGIFQRNIEISDRPASVRSAVNV